jgi:hypothetical protein
MESDPTTLGTHTFRIGGKEGVVTIQKDREKLSRDSPTPREVNTHFRQSRTTKQIEP